MQQNPVDSTAWEGRKKVSRVEPALKTDILNLRDKIKPKKSLFFFSMETYLYLLSATPAHDYPKESEKEREQNPQKSLSEVVQLFPKHVQACL